MKQYTVKDFILYNNPCISCGEKILLEFASLDTRHSSKTSKEDVVILKPFVKNERTEVDLKISYTSSINLRIDHKSNKFLSSNFEGLTDYLNKYKLYLRTRCNKCYSYIDSHFLEFNIARGFIKPVSISSEYFIIQDASYMYHIRSNSWESKTIVVVDRIDKTTPVSPIRFDLPIILLSKFKNKENIINKIKTYITFS